MKLTEQTCIACEGDMPPLNSTEARILLQQVPGWELTSDGRTISRTYIWKNFKEALAFINSIGTLAETEGHHPDLHLTNYKQVRVELTTHAIDGLSHNDFIMAAKIDAS